MEDKALTLGFGVRSYRKAAALLLLAAVTLAQPVLAEMIIIEQPEAIEIAREKGWIIREVTATETIELMAIANGVPKYYITHNEDAADSISTDECLPGGSSGLGLTGAGVTLGVWDGGGVRTSHQEYGGRAVQIDSPSGTHYHSTHVAGTMIASGVVASAKGMSPSADLDCYEWTDDSIEMDAAAGAGLRVSSHSYGFIHGWYYNQSYGIWFWYGDVTISTVEEYLFGFYSYYTEELDQIHYDNPYYLMVKSAGNDRNDDGPGAGGDHVYYDPGTENWEWSTATRNTDGDYDCVGTQASAKNNLTVAAVEDVIGGYSGTGSVTMSSFSSWGPTDDGRIKPDISANGVSLYSTLDGSDSDYYSLSGTSMSTPSASGSLGLLIQHWRATHAGDMRSATLKGLVLHTADEAGSANGPDYEFGWGLMNTLKAADAITDDVTEPITISEETLNNSATFDIDVTATGAAELRATICWTDPPGTPPSDSVDPPTKMLVNDLDLRIIHTSPPATYYPWVLSAGSPSSAATTGDNNTDNIEQVVLYSPGTASYTVEVTHKGSLSGGSQAYSLFITGASSGCQDDPDCDDDNPCTDDECVATVCEYTNNSALCDDDLYCNGLDTCSGGTCSQHAGDPCGGGGECNNSCNEVAETCYNPSGAACGDGTDNDCTDPDTCDGAGSCQPNHEPAAAICSDDLFCTETDECDGSGTCVGTGDPCSGGGECNNSCNEVAETCYNPSGIACGDGTDNDCTDP
ncbi:MAG: S8 family serine peptidase, partial [bacterium]|nr:S8 family serine peptidase [bacterium]